MSTDKFKGKTQEHALEAIKSYQVQLTTAKTQARKKKIQARIEEWREYLKRINK